jgi:hypothetical protein
LLNSYRFSVAGLRAGDLPGPNIRQPQPREKFRNHRHRVVRIKSAPSLILVLRLVLILVWSGQSRSLRGYSSLRRKRISASASVPVGLFHEILHSRFSPAFTNVPSTWWIAMAVAACQHSFSFHSPASSLSRACNAPKERSFRSASNHA